MAGPRSEGDDKAAGRPLARPLRLLLIDDDADDATLILFELRRHGYDPTSERVDTAAALGAALERQEWDMITCDWVMPQFSALAALDVIEEHHVDVPVIIVSGQVGEEFAVAAMKRGAHDFVSKHNLARLCPAIERELRESDDRRAGRRAEAARQDAEVRYRDLFDNVQDIIFAHDLEGNFISINEAAERITGYTRDEIIGRNITEVADREYWERVSHLRPPGISQDVPIVYDLEIIAKDGHRIPLEVSSRIILEREVPTRVQGIARDISKRKRAEEALRQSHEQRTSELLSLAHNMSAGTPLATRLQSLCQSAADLTGCDRSSIFLLEDRYFRAKYNVGNPQDIAEMFPQFKVRLDDPLICRAIETRGPVTLNDARDSQLMDQQTAREARIHSICVAPFLTESGEPTGFITIEYNEGLGYFSELNERLIVGLAKVAELAILAADRDIARRRAEEEVQRLNASLEEIVAARTAQLEAVNTELESFSWSVSHDLRAPLRSIEGFATALLEDYTAVLDDDGTAYLQRIQRAVGRMGELIEDLIRLAHVTAQEMQPASTDLGSLVTEIIDALREQHPERRVEVVIASDLHAVGDRRLLTTALENLLANAWKYTRKRPVARIEVGMTQHEGRPAYFVRDNGAGFDMAQAHRLFDAFQRLHPAIEFEGTGVGLATVQRIIRRHGGRIWAEAAVGQGATFYFTLGAPVS